MGEIYRKIKKGITVEWAFRIGIILKAINGLFEIMAGFAFLFFQQTTLLKLAILITRPELSEDPADIIANYLVKVAGNFSLGAQIFVTVYLLSHGVIKVFLVFFLLKKKLWAYPLAIFFFSAFVIYQAYRFFLDYSPAMLLLTILDIVIIYLTWVEYKKLCGKIKAYGDIGDKKI
jgi:uncharacterized membrane protein